MSGGLTRCADLPIRLVRPSRKQKKLAESKPLSCEMVPEAGFEPARLSTTVFETAASAVPPLGRRTALYLKPENSSSETNYS